MHHEYVLYWSVTRVYNLVLVGTIIGVGDVECQSHYSLQVRLLVYIAKIMVSSRKYLCVVLDWSSNHCKIIRRLPPTGQKWYYFCDMMLVID